MRGFIAPGAELGRGGVLGALVALVAGVAVVVVVAFAGVLFGAWPAPPGVSQDEWDWCTTRNGYGGPGDVEQAGANFLGWTEDGGLDHDGVTAAEVAARPNAGIACRLAYEFSPYHPSVPLSAEEQAWCSAAENRPMIDGAAQRLGSVAQQAPARTCRVAFILRSISSTGS